VSTQEGAVMSFRDHLRELRNRLVRVALALAAGFFLCWEYRVELFDFLSRPIAGALADNGIYHFQAIQITESVVVYLKVAFFADLLFLSPFIFWQLWAFVAPGLYDNEKRFVLPLTAFSVVFFFIGAAFSYTVLLPFVTNWLVQLTLDPGNIEVLVTVQNAYSFALTFLLMFGLVFQLPLVIFFLSLWGMATGRGLLRFWRYFVVISVLLSAILTPPDPLSQVLMAVPLNVLYGFGILVAFAVARARARSTDNVGSAALKMMALALVGALALALAVVLLIASLPERALTSWVPERAGWVVGANPKALLGDDDVRANLSARPGIAAGLERLKEAGLDPGELTDAAVVGEGALRALLLRAPDAAEVAPRLHGLLAPPEGDPIAADDWVAGALAPDVLAVGHRNLVVAMIEVGFDGAPAARADADDDRMLRRLAASGPAWGWLPSPDRDGSPLLGAEPALDVGHAGAVLSLGERRRVVMHLRARAPERVDALDAALQASRERGAAKGAGDRLDEVVEVLRGLAAEVERLAPEGERARVSALQEELERLSAPGVAPGPVTAMTKLGPMARGWSIRRNESWFILTTELEDDVLPALIGWFARPPLPADR